MLVVFFGLSKSTWYPPRSPTIIPIRLHLLTESEGLSNTVAILETLNPKP